MVALAALLVYDYFLTLEDEVAEFHDDNNIEKNPDRLAQVRYVWKSGKILSAQTLVLFMEYPKQ